jgi:hypothetical protein
MTKKFKENLKFKINFEKITKLLALCRKYALTPAFRQGNKKRAEFGFSRELTRILNRIVRAKAQNLLVV